MAVLEVPFHSPWFFSRWAFRILLERGMERVGGNRDDVYLLEQAIALDGLVIEAPTSSQEVRLMRAIGIAAGELFEEWRAKQDADEWDRDYTGRLEHIAMILRAAGYRGEDGEDGLRSE